jgi:gluconate 2-dehydrogenase alpha chain
MKRLPAVDVVIVGGGWTGLLMAKELGSRTPLSVVVLERGGPRRTEDYAVEMDELNTLHFRMMQDLSQETVTIRHSVSQRAVPLRQHGAFLPGSGVGGAGEHWGGWFPRFFPDTFRLRSHLREKYGESRFPSEHTVEDWGITYDELEPFYTRAEYLVGASGKAGNIRGRVIPGGNIFEGWRSTEYPTPPNKIPYVASLFQDATKSLGYHPYPLPSATISTSFTNPDGVSRPGCTYCGFCDRYGCMIGAKAQPTNTLLPVIRKHSNISIRTGSWARRIVHASADGKVRVTGVTYVNDSGEEVFQPADLTVLASWTLNNNRLLLLSGIGDGYDPSTGKGNLGRNLTHQVSMSLVTLFFDKPLNRFMGSAAAGIRVSDFDSDLIDKTELPFLQGGSFNVSNLTTGPIANFGTLPPSMQARWGSDWKKASLYHYDRSSGIRFAGEHLAYKGNCMDLDPRYTDRFGDPLLRMTIDWHENEWKMVEFMSKKAAAIGRAMGATQVVPFLGSHTYDTRRYQSSHIQGGTIMGSSPDRSVLNNYLQHWNVSNLFVLGASSFPQNASPNPTATILALTYRSADAIIDRYLKRPGLLS